MINWCIQCVDRKGCFFTDTWCLFSTHRSSRDYQCIILPTQFHESHPVPSGVHTALHHPPSLRQPQDKSSRLDVSCIHVTAKLTCQFRVAM